MATAETASTTQNLNLTKFVNCCDGTEILFTGSLSLITGSVYTYIGATPYTGEGGELIPGQCYQFFPELATDIVTYPTTPTLAQFNGPLNDDCVDPQCPDCNPSDVCECPEGFTYNPITDECERTLETVAEYSGGLLEVEAGDKNEGYGQFGVRLYPDITLMPWPLLGDGPSYTSWIIEDGAGSAVIPTDIVQNELWGSNVAGCDTGSTGGRLNNVGIWATGYGTNEELSFEFCIDIPGQKEKQYLIGIAGDNKVKIYIDGVLAVFLDAASGVSPAITQPFNFWHVFPVSLTPGNHVIKLSGINLPSGSGGTTDAAFGAEIYDITLADFQANLLTPAIFPNCGNTEADLEPYIIFSTRDTIGQLVANPDEPGVWSCPDGSAVDFCQGAPICTITETIPAACDCYYVIPCDGTEPFVSIDPSYAPYENTFVEVSGPEYTGCAYVLLTDTEYCNDTTVTTVPTGVACDCDLRCWFVENSNGFSIVDENNTFVSISAVDASPYIRICSKIPPVPEEGTNLDLYNAVELGDCSIVDNVAECPELCFILTNCETAETIYSNSDVLYPYTFTGTNVVEILGREGCWIVQQGDPEVDPCDCLVNVTVIRSYNECEDCIKTTYYKLTSCDTNDVIYSNLNLEIYVGKVLKTDCGCYEVEVIDYEPPNIQEIKIEGLYNNCISCTRTYYELVDCAGVADNIYTYTDLSLVVGQVIKVENCDECWTVNLVENSEPIYAGAGEVVLTETHDTCEDCQGDLVCTCSQVTNYSETQERTYEYLNCDNEVVEITLQPGESSGRICILKWLPREYCGCFIVTLVQGDVTGIYTATPTGDVLNGYPVYNLCVPSDPLINCFTASWNGSNWIIYPEGTSGGPSDIRWILNDPTLGVDCPLGVWEEENGGKIPVSATSSECPIVDCTCVVLTLEYQGVTTETTYTVVGYDASGNPVFEDADGNQITYDGKLWNTTISLIDVETEAEDLPCPTGNWVTNVQGLTLTSEECLDPTPQPSDNDQTLDYLPTDYFETFGECQHGVCPPRTFPNKRVITPGYNTPICTPEKYDMITCNFADVMYKMVLEKRYGITNCCPEDDHKWMVKKELIDLQALKDPDYKCSECDCNDHSSNNCSTCKSEN